MTTQFDALMALAQEMTDRTRAFERFPDRDRRAAKRRRANALARARRAHSERKPAGHFQYVITSGPFAGLGA